jgi:hypothetical protein
LVIAEGWAGTTEIAANTIIVAVGLVPTSNLYNEIKENLEVEVEKIGDYVKVAKIMDAMHMGYKTGLRI